MIGGMFSIRMIGSAATRLPSGAITSRIPVQYLMLTALAIGTASVLSMAFVTDHVLLTVLLACEGIAFGMYFASGTTAIAKHTEEANRGTATGLFITAGSFGTTLGPIGLGRAADAWGLSSVYLITGIVLLAGFLGNLYLHSRARSRNRIPVRADP
jgi:MFS family permease